MSKAWIALALAPTVALFGCKSKPEPVSAVPPPTYAAEPEPLPPVSINEGTSVGPDTSAQPAPQAYPQGQPGNRTYIIQKNDTFWGIASREYGNGQRWVDIAQANPSLDPKRLPVGQQITLP